MHGRLGEKARIRMNDRLQSVNRDYRTVSDRQQVIFISNPFFQSTHQLLGKAKRWRSVPPLDTLNQTAINEMWHVIFTHDAHSQVNVTLTPVLHPPSIYSCLSSWPFHQITSWTNTCRFLTARNWCFSPSTTKKTYTPQTRVRDEWEELCCIIEHKS